MGHSRILAGGVELPIEPEPVADDFDDAGAVGYGTGRHAVDVEGVRQQHDVAEVAVEKLGDAW